MNDQKVRDFFDAKLCSIILNSLNSATSADGTSLLKTIKESPIISTFGQSAILFLLKTRFRQAISNGMFQKCFLEPTIASFLKNTIIGFNLYQEGILNRHGYIYRPSQDLQAAFIGAISDRAKFDFTGHGEMVVRVCQSLIDLDENLVLDDLLGLQVYQFMLNCNHSTSPLPSSRLDDGSLYIPIKDEKALDVLMFCVLASTAVFVCSIDWLMEFSIFQFQTAQ
jgi:hypothetical protein